MSPELIGLISKQVVITSHEMVGKKKEYPLKARCDSWVLETNVHFPTDLNLLWGAVRKVVILTARYALWAGISSWRQWQYNLRQLKKLYRRVQTIRHSTSKNPDKKALREDEIRTACQNYLNAAQALIEKAENTLKDTKFVATCTENKLAEINEFIAHALLTEYVSWIRLNDE